MEGHFRRSQPNFAWTVGRLWPQLFFSFFLERCSFFRKKRFLAAILANIGLRISSAYLGIDAECFHVLHTLRSAKSTTA